MALAFVVMALRADIISCGIGFRAGRPSARLVGMVRRSLLTAPEPRRCDCSASWSGVQPAQRQPKAESFGGEVERYLLHKRSMKPETFRAIERHLGKYAKPLHPLSLAEIDRRRVAQLLAKIEMDSGPVARNRLRSSLSTFFTGLVKEGLLDTTLS